MDKVGVWLDQKRAVIVKLTNDIEEPVVIENIRSHVEPWHKSTGGMASARPYAQRSAYSDVENKLKERRKHELKSFYDKIIDKITDAGSIIIFGPSQAKTGLKKEIAKHKSMANKLLSVQASDLMTKRQVVAKIKKYYLDIEAKHRGMAQVF